MDDPCEICKGTEFIGNKKRCVRCAEGSAAAEIGGSGKGQGNTSTHRGKKKGKLAAGSSPSEELSAQDNTSEDEELDSDGLQMPSNDYVLSRRSEQSGDQIVQAIEQENPGHVESGIDKCPVCGTGIVSSQGEGSRQNLDDQLSHRETDYGLILRSSLSGAQNERVNECIQNIKPETVVFVAVMKKGDVQPPSPLLIISKERSLVEAARFPNKSGTTVTLQIPGIKSKKWQPIFLLEKGEYMLAGNWLGFTNDNHVQVGDMCVFVPLKDGKSSEFTVHVLPTKATHPRACIRDATTASVVNADEPSHEVIVSSEGNICGVRHQLLHGEDAFILPRFLNLTTSQQEIVDKRAKAIRSRYPLYVATMNPSMDEEGIGPQKEKEGLQRIQFEFSKKYARAVHLPTGERDMILWCMEKDWKTKMKYIKDSKGYRWMITDGWCKFAVENGLRKGDMCLFELKSMNEEEIIMKVHVVRKEKF